MPIWLHHLACIACMAMHFPCIFMHSTHVHAFFMHSRHVLAFFMHSTHVTHFPRMHSMHLPCIYHACCTCTFLYISCMLMHLHSATHDPRNFLEKCAFFLVFSWPNLGQQKESVSHVPISNDVNSVRASDFNGGLQVPHAWVLRLLYFCEQLQPYGC